MFEHLECIYLRKVASEGINNHVEHCIFVPASRVLFSSRCPTFRVSLLSSSIRHAQLMGRGNLSQFSLVSLRSGLFWGPILASR